MRIVLDIEANDLLENAIDYSSTPYKLKDTFRIWCIVCTDIISKKSYSFFGDTLFNLEQFIIDNVDEIIGHNIIDYDLPAMTLYGLIDYSVGYDDGEDYVCGKKVKITDTLVMSKLLYSDTVQGHSLEDWGKRLGEHKTEFSDWSQFSQEMLDYCIQDTKVNVKLYWHLLDEYQSWNWAKSFRMETKLADITVAQKHYGFAFNSEQAQACVVELDQIMQELRAKVDPILPPKKLNKGELKEFVPPKIQFKKNGEPSSHMLKFAEKHGWDIMQLPHTGWKLVDKIGQQSWDLPLEVDVPLITTGVASIEDNDHVKGYLLSLGWEPSAWKERDLTMDSKKHKVSEERFKENVERYVEQTLSGVYKEARLEILETTEEYLRMKLLAHADLKKPLRVPTSPQVSLPPEKELCPGLIALGEKVAFAKDFAHFMTYRHRRNSIAGGLDEDGEPSKGFLTAARCDGRIATPADTNGCNTGRYQHRLVANIPRLTSLYGEKMRGLFGVSKNKIQLGFDFASLEARVEGHYVYRYEGGPDLAAVLLMEKPNDLHSVMAKKLGIIRDHAKSMNYALLYGAQPRKLMKMLGCDEHRAKEIYNQFWEELSCLKNLKDNLEKYWEGKNKKFILGIDGRKIYTRSKHSLINALFQSAGALIAKYVAVEIARTLDEQELFLHPFYDDVENASGVSQMIVYHDECQYSVSRDLVNFKSFETEEEAKAYKQHGVSAVGHGKKYFRAFSPMAEVINNAINKVTEDLKFNVDLGFEWQVGKNWADCH